jgi:gamma-glutamyltranspeptidase/glutathione hydrolase
MGRVKFLTGALLALALVPAAANGDGPSAVGRKGMVVSVSRPASEVGVAVLKKGGNAVDAAVAVAFALAVTWPEAGNVGGGGFMLVHPARGRPEPAVIDYRETAPAAATRDMFAKDRKPSSHKLAAVPGTVAGLALAHRTYGKLPWKEVVLPAVGLAEDGFALDAALAAGLNKVVARSAAYPELRRVLGKEGGRGAWEAGDRLVQRDLGQTLRRIAEHGPDGFYKGPVADLIVAEMRRGGGLITKADLAGYKAKVRRPVHGTYRGHDVYGPPPPSSGGTGLIEMLNVLENFDLKKRGRSSADTLHLMAEAMRRAYCDRARYLGDPDFVKVPAHLTSKDYARKLAKGIDLKKATRSEELAPDLPLTGEGDSTTHFSVLDADGMAVSNTYTLEHSYGGRVVVRGAGFLLNNQMGDFNPRPGVTTRAGLIGTPPNQVAPGKRMLSSMTPVVVARDGKVVLVTGSPGGRTIINTVLCVVLNVLEFGMPLREAVDAPRLHHAWFPDRLDVEPGLAKKHAAALKRLEAMGHRLAPRPQPQGDAHSIVVDPAGGAYRGEADTRRSGWAAGR